MEERGRALICFNWSLGHIYIGFEETSVCGLKLFICDHYEGL